MKKFLGNPSLIALSSRPETAREQRRDSVQASLPDHNGQLQAIQVRWFGIQKGDGAGSLGRRFQHPCTPNSLTEYETITVLTRG